MPHFFFLFKLYICKIWTTFMEDLFTDAQNGDQPSCHSTAVLSKPRPSTPQLKEPLVTGGSQGLSR